MRCAACGAQVHSIEADGIASAEKHNHESPRCPACAATAPAPVKGAFPDGSAVPIAPALSLSAAANGDLDECESLLRHAIELLKEPAQPSQPSAAHTAQRPPTPPAREESVPVHPAPPTSLTTPVTAMVSDFDSYLDEIETLLRRAKEMVRDPASGARRTNGLTDAD
jgi:hypothetical protein